MYYCLSIFLSRFLDDDWLPIIVPKLANINAFIKYVVMFCKYGLIKYKHK